MRRVSPGRWWASGLVLMVAIGLAVASVLGTRHPLSGTTPPGPVRLEIPKAPDPTVALTPEKTEAAGLRVGEVGTAAVAVEVVEPGRIEANSDRRIEIRPRASGVIRSVAVALGQEVRAGDLLVTLNSVEVGSARLNLRSRQRELVFARSEALWRAQVAANVEELIPALRKNVPTVELERRFATRPLGTDRASLLSAYADWQIALHEEAKQTDLYRRQIVGEHPAVLALHTREGAQAKFEAALEQVRYDVDRQRRLADQQARLAESATTDAAHRLRILGIDVDPAAAVADPESALDEAADADTDAVTAYPIVAPFEGTIIQKSAVPSQRAEPADILLTLADLRTVRIVVHVPEADFALLTRLGKGSLRVTTAAYPGRMFPAKVLHVGAQVDPTTRSVTLMAEAANPEGLLKLGMFVRVVLEEAATETAVVVPDAALVEIEGQPTVFVAEGDDRTFVPRPVIPGRSFGDQREITSGLRPGERVATAGAFALKSEWLLQGEAGED